MSETQRLFGPSLEESDRLSPEPPAAPPPPSRNCLLSTLWFCNVSVFLSLCHSLALSLARCVARVSPSTESPQLLVFSRTDCRGRKRSAGLASLNQPEVLQRHALTSDPWLSTELPDLEKPGLQTEGATRGPDPQHVLIHQLSFGFPSCFHTETR